LYDSFLSNPPHGVDYVISRLSLRREDKSRLAKLKRLVWTQYTKYFPPIVRLSRADCDLIHSTAGILLNTKDTWVIDTENVYGFVNHAHTKLPAHKKQIQAILEKDNCKAIMPHCEAAKRSIENFFQSDIINKKLTVLYPAMPMDIIAKQAHDDFTFLFVGVRFLEKGGRETLNAFELFRKKHAAKLVMISNMPSEYAQKYENDPDVTIVPATLSRERVLEYMSKADVFMFPSYKESFGIVYMEAMSMGLPIITVEVCAGKELVEGAGIVLKSPISWHDTRDLLQYPSWPAFVLDIENNSFPEFEKDLAHAMSTLFNDADMRATMGRVGEEKVRNGVLSVAYRNETLKRVYEAALK